MNSRIFYTLGRPIPVTQREGIYCNPRKKIPTNELVESFSEENIQTIKLFNTEDEAFKYCYKYGERRDNGRSAIFKVEYLGSNIDWQQEDIKFVISHYRQVKSEFDDIKGTSTQEITQFKINYIEVNRNEVKPLEGALKIKSESRSDPQGTRTLVYLDYSVQNQNKITSHFSCTLI